MKRSIKILLFCISTLTLISWDRASKELAKKYLKDKEVISYCNDTFRLEYVENTGAAMSLGDSWPKEISFWVLGILPLAFMLAMGVYAIKQSGNMHPLKLTALALLLAGGIGNIYDRLVYDRHVTDFMNIGVNNVRTGIFNFADMCITAGAILLLLSFSKEKKSEVYI